MAAVYGRISGWGAYTPSKIVTNADLTKIVDTSDDWIMQRSGIRERRIAEPHETTATMAVQAARAALERAELTALDVDLIIVATNTPDQHTPPVSSVIQHGLDAPGVPAFVVVTGCTGFVYALTVAYQFIATGAYRTILVVGAEILSRFVNWEDRSTCVLFGDGAGAVVVQAAEQPCGLLGFDLGSDGRHSNHIKMVGGGSAKPFSAEVLDNSEHYISMNGREVFKFATRIIGRACSTALSRAGLSYEDVDWIIPHQANLRIIQTAAEMMHVPLDRFIVNIDRYANTSAASIPLALSEALDGGRIAADDTVLMVGFGAGLTWGAAVVQLAPALASQPAHNLHLNGSVGTLHRWLV